MIPEKIYFLRFLISPQTITIVANGPYRPVSESLHESYAHQFDLIFILFCPGVNVDDRATGIRFLSRFFGSFFVLSCNGSNRVSWG